MEKKGILYLVSTPIGNLEDITFRAVRVLKEVHLIAAEDTRTTKVLLDHYSINTSLISCYAQNEKRRVELFFKHLGEGRSVALVSENGTPGISDPGEQVVKAVVKEGFQVVPVPGPTALIAGLCVSGLQTGHFFFGGFLPRKPTAIQQTLAGLKNLPGTLIFYESPRRLVATLKLLHQELGDRDAAVARELTKTFEEMQRGSLVSLQDLFAGRTSVKGEVVILIAGMPPGGEAKPDKEWLTKAIAELREKGLSRKDAVLALKKTTPFRRRDIYQSSLK